MIKVSQQLPTINQQLKLIMIVELTIPIETLRGKLKEDGYYFRMYRGKQIVQRCPRKWVDTPARKAARERFIRRYRKGQRPASDAGVINKIINH